MSYVARILPPEEWPRLAGTEADTVWHRLDPVNTRVVVVERDGQIVGTWLALRAVHVECLWIDHAHRHVSGISRRLLMAMRRVVQDWGASAVLTHALTNEVRGLIQHAGGTEVPGREYIIPLTEREVVTCQPSL